MGPRTWEDQKRKRPWGVRLLEDFLEEADWS
jgi:hypothetical protein